MARRFTNCVCLDGLVSRGSAPGGPGAGSAGAAEGSSVVSGPEADRSKMRLRSKRLIEPSRLPGLLLCRIAALERITASQQSPLTDGGWLSAIRPAWKDGDARRHRAAPLSTSCA